jgi:hypothetical protein
MTHCDPQKPTTRPLNRRQSTPMSCPFGFTAPRPENDSDVEGDIDSDTEEIKPSAAGAKWNGLVGLAGGCDGRERQSFMCARSTLPCFKLCQRPSPSS